MPALAGPGRRPTRRRRQDAELVRLIGMAPHQAHLQAPTSIAVVVERARDLGARAVLIESWPAGSAELVGLARALDPTPVLRPYFERRPGGHAGPPEERFAGYHQLRPVGDLVALAEGALA